MIIGKIWGSFKAQMNKLANFLWRQDPMAQLQYEYDKLVDQLKEGREGLEQHRALVERVGRQTKGIQDQVSSLEARVKAYLSAGDRDTAAKFALELQKARKNLEENQGQLKMHEESYANNLAKIQHATGKLGQLKEKIMKYDADLKMSRAEAELAKVARSFKVDITTDFGEVEDMIQTEIDKNRAKAKVAADMSSEGIDEIRRDDAVEKALADQALREFEQQIGTTPATRSLPAPSNS